MLKVFYLGAGILCGILLEAEILNVCYWGQEWYLVGGRNTKRILLEAGIVFDWRQKCPKYFT